MVYGQIFTPLCVERKNNIQRMPLRDKYGKRNINFVQKPVQNFSFGHKPKCIRLPFFPYAFLVLT